MFIKESKEGLGCRLLNIVMAMALAAKNDMNLGAGVVQRGYCHKSHGYNMVPAIEAVLGLTDPQELFTDSPPAYNFTFAKIADMEDALANGTVPKTGATVFLAPAGNVLAQFLIDHARRRFKSTDGITEYLDTRFLASLRDRHSPLADYRLLFAAGRPSVALHVRRGDIRVEDPKAWQRTTDDEWYYEVVEHIRSVLPNADVHVWSSLEKNHNASEFDGYTRRGMTVHLNDTDFIEPWAHFSRADVFVMAKSGFSYLPGLLSPHCVIYQNWWYYPIRSWIQAEGALSKLDADALSEHLLACLATKGLATRIPKF